MRFALRNALHFRARTYLRLVYRRIRDQGLEGSEGAASGTRDCLIQQKACTLKHLFDDFRADFGLLRRAAGAPVEAAYLVGKCDPFGAADLSGPAVCRFTLCVTVRDILSVRGVIIMATLNIRLDNELDQQLAREAELAEQTRSQLARQAIAAFVAQRERERFLGEIARAARSHEGSEAVALAEEALVTDNEALRLAEHLATEPKARDRARAKKR